MEKVGMSSILRTKLRTRRAGTNTAPKLGLIHLQKKPKQLPIMLIMIAEVAAGNATAGEEKWEVAKTTPKA
ncbi:hypothetical protein H5410_064916 [Solanum commersonii]|uniref:Uncharacterized protein n=1 Tax=Solanum commersonii TaxID=4109 RepID=A0A9J5VY10_SOLCO|nr:hypothetical protein H5410_064916 [Solanum commersonii]